MSPDELKRHSKVIDESVSFIEAKTDQIWKRYEEIEDCVTEECNKERSSLGEEMDAWINKLQNEEKMIDQYEEILHNKTGIK